MKKHFEEPKVEITVFSVEDIVTASGAGEEDPTPGGNGSPIL